MRDFVHYVLGLLIGFYLGALTISWIIQPVFQERDNLRNTLNELTIELKVRDFVEPIVPFDPIGPIYPPVPVFPTID